MATKRVKPSKIIPITSDDQIDNLLFQIAQLKIKLKRIDADAEEAINKIRESAQAQAAPIQDEIDRLGNSIFAYAEYNRDRLFNKAKTLQFTFGSIGYRQSTRLVITKQTLDILKEMELYDCIIVKEAVNKEVLSTKPEEIIRQARAKKIIEDKFWYEVKEEEITNTNQKVVA